MPSQPPRGTPPGDRARVPVAALTHRSPRPRSLWLVVLLACVGMAWAQVSVPTFGTRGGVPDALVTEFMTALRHAVAQDSGLAVSEGDLITPGIAGSLEPEFAMLIAELDSARYAVSGEIARSGAGAGEPYAVSLLVVDAERSRSSDLISRALDPADLEAVAADLGGAVAGFIGAAVALPEGDAGVFISSEPGDADVFLDGVAVGRTGRLDVLMLQPGRHRLEVRKEGFLPESRNVDLLSGDTGFVHVILTAISGGSIQLSSAPDARVYLDGAREGRTPLTLPALPGSHTVRLEREGFLPETFSVLVRNYRVTRVDASLRPRHEPLVFWDEERSWQIAIDGVVQNGGYAVGLQPGLRTFELRRGADVRTVLRAVPPAGVYRLELDTGELAPAGP